MLAQEIKPDDINSKPLPPPPAIVHNFDEMPIIGRQPVKKSPVKSKTPSKRLSPHQRAPPPDVEFRLTDMNMQQCPFCKRNFNEVAAKRHIPICENTRNRAKPPPSKQELMQQRINRKNDQLKKPRQISVRVDAKIDSGRNMKKTQIPLQKILTTKNTVNQLVNSNIITELQKQRESPFLRRDSNRSFISKGSFQSSPCRYISPL